MLGTTGREKLQANQATSQWYRSEADNSRNGLTSAGCNDAHRWHVTVDGRDLAVRLVDLVEVPEPESSRGETYEKTDNNGDGHRHSPSAWSQLHPPRDQPMELSGQRVPTLDAGMPVGPSLKGYAVRCANTLAQDAIIIALGRSGVSSEGPSLNIILAPIRVGCSGGGDVLTAQGEPVQNPIDRSPNCTTYGSEEKVAPLNAPGAGRQQLGGHIASLGEDNAVVQFARVDCVAGKGIERIMFKDGH